MQDQAEIHVYDPKVSANQIVKDLNEISGEVFDCYNSERQSTFSCSTLGLGTITVHKEPSPAMENAHAIAVLTEWDSFKEFDWKLIFDKMKN